MLLTHPAQEQLGGGCSEQAMLGFTFFSYTTLPPPCCGHQPQSVQILLGKASQPSPKSVVGDRSVYPLFSGPFVTNSSLSIVGLDQLISLAEEFVEDTSPHASRLMEPKSFRVLPGTRVRSQMCLVFFHASLVPCPFALGLAAQMVL